MKVNEEIMEILEAFHLTHSNEAAARLAGCDPKTVGPLRRRARVRQRPGHRCAK
jgi:hypothetical protein